jgi:hypothetical protein
MNCQFDTFDPKIRRRGLTSIEAFDFMRSIRPDIPHWIFWDPTHLCISAMIRDTRMQEGAVGDWRWSRVPCAYPALVHYTGPETEPNSMWRWTGLLEVASPAGESFLLFSYLDSAGMVGARFMVSAPDMELPNRFLEAVRRAFEPDEMIVIDVAEGDNIRLPRSSNEWLILYRRGLLFAGPPGCGKTMMVRRVIRECDLRFKAKPFSVRIHRGVDEDTIGRLFRRASKARPSLVVLDDLDSLTKECQLTRAGLLSQLDGIRSPEGMLVIGTTNNPGDIDPALVHRPSRFDRVWHFNLPDSGMRSEYLRHTMDGLGPELRDELVRRTQGWSFAYLNELRISTAMFAIREGRPAGDESCVRDAVDLLSSQFKSGRKGHAEPTLGQSVGFGMAQE